jgi:hypothetical protein
MEPVKGTQQLHAVSSCQGDRDGSNEKLRKLRIAIKPCSCLKCRGKTNGVCEFVEYRQENIIWVEEECDDPSNQTKPTRQPTIHLTQEVEEQLKRKMCVTERVTNETLRTYLKAKGQRTSGLKSELVAQVLALQQGCDDPVPLALTCTTTVDVEDI